MHIVPFDLGQFLSVCGPTITTVILLLLRPGYAYEGENLREYLGRI